MEMKTRKASDVLGWMDSEGPVTVAPPLRDLEQPTVGEAKAIQAMVASTPSEQLADDLFAEVLRRCDGDMDETCATIRSWLKQIEQKQAEPQASASVDVEALVEEAYDAVHAYAGYIGWEAGDVREAIRDVITRAVQAERERADAAERELNDVRYVAGKFDDKPHLLFSKMMRLTDDEDAKKALDHAYNNIHQWQQADARERALEDLLRRVRERLANRLQHVRLLSRLDVHAKNSVACDLSISVGMLDAYKAQQKGREG